MKLWIRSSFAVPALCLSLLLISLGISSSSAALLHVPLGYPTIQDAVDAASDGDSIMIAAGVYTGPGNRDIVIPTLISLNLDIIGLSGSENVIIDCEHLGGGFKFTTDMGSIHFKGMTIRNGSDYAFESVVVGSMYLEDIRLSGFTSTVISVSSGYTTMNNCLLQNNIVQTGPLVELCGRRDGTVSDCRFVRNECADGLEYVISTSHGSPYNHVLRFERVTIADNHARGIRVHQHMTVEFDSSILAFSHSTLPAIGIIENYENSHFEATCSDFFGNTGGNTCIEFPDPVGSDGNIGFDPLFCDLANGDFQLSSISPCLPENNDCGVQMGALGQGCGGEVFIISGCVTHEDGTPMANLLIEGPTSTFTDEAGDFELLVEEGWSGSFAPDWFYFSDFNPPEHSYVDVGGDIIGQDFVALGRRHCLVPSEYASIAEAMETAVSGDSVLVEPGTYSFSGPIGIDFAGEEICLKSSAGTAATILNFSGLSTADYGVDGIQLTQGEGASAVVDGFTITGDPYCWLDAIRCGSGSSPVLKNLDVHDLDWASGLRTTSASPLVEDCVFTSIGGSWWSANACPIDCVSGTPIFRRVTISGCHTDGPGAVKLEDVVSAEFHDVEFLDNTAYSGFDGETQCYWAGYGGAIRSINVGNLLLEGCTFNNNRALMYSPYNISGRGGALYIRDSQVQINSCIFADNLAEEGTGGAILSRESDVSISACSFVGNTARSWDTDIGGAHLCLESGGSIDVEQTIFAFGGSGGGIWSDIYNGIALNCCDLFQNTGGDFVGLMDDQIGINGNFAADPIFCDVGADDYHLHILSPCMPEFNSCGVQIGALGSGCGGVFHTICGRITYTDGTPMGGMRVVGPITTYTDADGYFTSYVQEGWSGSMEPDWFHFNTIVPPERVYTAVAGDLIDQDFVAHGQRHCLVPSEYPTIPAAMYDAVSSDSVLVSPGTYNLAGSVGIDFHGSDIHLLATDGPETTILDFSGMSGSASSLTGVDFTQGEGPGAILDGFTLTGDPADYSVDAIVCRTGVSPTLRNLVVRDLADCSGLYIHHSSPTIEDCIFTNLHGGSLDAGFVGAPIYCKGGSPVFCRVVIQNNSNQRYSGAVRLIDVVAAEFHETSFIGNLARSGYDSGTEVYYGGEGGGLYAHSSQVISVDCLFADNIAEGVDGVAPGWGGAVFSWASDFAITTNTFVGNLAGPGTGVGYGGHYCRRSGGAHDFQQTIFAFADGGGGIWSGTNDGVDLTCCDVYENVDGDFVGLMDDQIGVNGNISEDPIFCDLAAGDYGVQYDSPCLPDNNDCGLQIGAFGNTCVGTPVQDDPIPAVFALQQNHPNPFNPETEINFSLAKAGAVDLKIFDVRGRVVRALLSAVSLEAGPHQVIWNGCDGGGTSLASGIYFSRLESNDKVITRKMTLLK